ncbi:hypothetical protein INS49_010346 [Diaporthe citri]|uniref:uncharacterized protein n=1 Tax=Diaporthe citri TaxID=83186 RepID=UPI001C7EA20B|nr:uncharacterized protein INS49_010346 [Diaporthe citri]KAG6362117.1 hypothetical protein INS49_010346 [Diaporthe citri]
MALRSRYGESFDLVSNITKRKVSAMEIFVRGQYEDRLRDHDNADELIDIARSEALEKTRLSVMREHTAVGPNGTMKLVSTEFYIQHILRRMWFICCHDQCDIAFQDVPPFPIKLADTDEDTEGPRAPEHIREIQSKEKKDQQAKERAERAEKEKAKTTCCSGLEERHRRQTQELTAAHLKEIQDLKAQTLLDIKELKDTFGQLRGNENPKVGQK